MHPSLFIAALLTFASASEENQCGPRALAICASVCGTAATVEELDGLIGRKGENTSLQDLDFAAKTLGLSTLPLHWKSGVEFRGTWSGSGVISVITPRGEGHFFAVLACDEGKFLLESFPAPPFWARVSELRERWRWDGTILHVGASEADLAALRPKRFDAWCFVFGLLAYVGGRSVFSRRSPDREQRAMSMAVNANGNGALFEHT
jgi:hypothetical protein